MKDNRQNNHHHRHTHDRRMPDDGHHVRVAPHRQEHEQRQAAEHVQQPQMMDARLAKHFFREDVLQRETDGGDERTDQAEHVERDLGEGGNGDARDDRHETEIDDGGLALAEDQARQDDGEQGHGGFYCVEDI